MLCTLTVLLLLIKYRTITHLQCVFVWGFNTLCMICRCSSSVMVKMRMLLRYTVKTLLRNTPRWTLDPIRFQGVFLSKLLPNLEYYSHNTGSKLLRKVVSFTSKEICYLGSRKILSSLSHFENVGCVTRMFLPFGTRWKWRIVAVCVFPFLWYQLRAWIFCSSDAFSFEPSTPASESSGFPVLGFVGAFAWFPPGIVVNINRNKLDCPYASAFECPCCKPQQFHHQIHPLVPSVSLRLSGLVGEDSKSFLGWYIILLPFLLNFIPQTRSISRKHVEKHRKMMKRNDYWA